MSLKVENTVSLSFDGPHDLKVSIFCLQPKAGKKSTSPVKQQVGLEPGT